MVYFVVPRNEKITSEQKRKSMKLNSKQRQYLKGLGHSLKPVIQVGKDGLSQQVLSSISKALDDHELIKINILETADIEREQASSILTSALNAEVIQTLGRKILLFRRNNEKQKIEIPQQ